MTNAWTSSKGLAPILSVGLAVRNANDTIGRCIESILSQSFTDFELVISDNASDDGTADILREYGRLDSRIRLVANQSNVGSHENMRRVLAHARGTLFRWISADDWLEPKCLLTCVEALKNRADAIGVTTWFTIHVKGGQTRYEEYPGEFPESPDPTRRFERMLWFFHAGDARYDPIYGVYRRDCLARTHGLRPSERNDWLLCAELALLGPIVHVGERLAHRTRDYRVGFDRAAFRQRLDPLRAEELRTSPLRLYNEMLDMVDAARLTEDQVQRCRTALQRFLLKEVIRTGRERIADARHRVLTGGSHREQRS